MTKESDDAYLRSITVVAAKRAQERAAEFLLEYTKDALNPERETKPMLLELSEILALRLAEEFVMDELKEQLDSLLPSNVDSNQTMLWIKNTLDRLMFETMNDFHKFLADRGYKK